MLVLVAVLAIALGGPEPARPRPVESAAPEKEQTAASSAGTPDEPPANGPLVEGPRTKAFFEKIGRELPGVGEIGGRIYWDGGDGVRVPIPGTRLGNPVFETEIGLLEVDASLAEWAPADMGPSLRRLVAIARGAGLGTTDVARDSGFLLDHDLLFGFHLSSNETMVVAGGVARREALADRGVDSDKATLRAAVARFHREIESSALGSISRAALLDLVDRLDDRDAEEEELDLVRPSFARKLVRRGWLTALADLAKIESARAVESAVVEMMKLQPTIAYRGEGLEFVKSQDALGHRSWFLRTPERTGYAVEAHQPYYHSKARKALESEGRLVVLLRPGVDPRTSNEFADRIVEARLHHGRTVLARWTAEEGFRAEQASWRVVAPELPDRGTTRNWFPPHIMVTDLQHDPILLLTAHGSIAPPRRPDADEAERFLSEAAKVLVDPAHLDLFGEHLFTYVYDSPDTAVPLLVGNRTHSGEIHQTAEQSMLTAVGGVCRGDCDDLAEVYTDLLRRQGKLAHVIGVPGHAASGYCEKSADGWHTYILQTGPALEFVDSTVAGSLKKCWESFEAGDQFDPNAITVLLRFDGENTRKHFSLGCRIFEDPVYATTMIDVQQGWHEGTYHQSIQKVERLVAAGDDQVSTYKELSGLHARIGEDDRAVEYDEKAFEKTTDPAGRIERAIDLVGTYFSAGQTEKGRALAGRILDELIPRAGSTIGVVQGLRIHLDLLEALMRRATDLAGDLLVSRLAETMERLILSSAQQAASGAISREEWGHTPESRILDTFTSDVLDLLSGLDRERTGPLYQALLDLLEPYYAYVAIFDAADPQSVMEPYSRIARFYEVSLGEAELEARVEAASYPGSLPPDHWRRSTGEDQVRRDLPWIKVSVRYWCNLLFRAVGDLSGDEVDAGRIRHLHGRMTEALAAGRRIDALDMQNETMAMLGDILAALALEDEAAIRKQFRFVREKNDRARREMTATYVGKFAKAVSPDAFGRIFAAWSEELGNKPQYFQIAWQAATTGASDQALIVARTAVERFPDDPGFAAEYAYLKKKFGKCGQRGEGTSPSPRRNSPITKDPGWARTHAWRSPRGRRGARDAPCPGWMNTPQGCSISTVRSWPGRILEPSPRPRDRQR